MKKFDRRAAVFVLVMGTLMAGLLLLILSGKFTVNISPSVPLGLWLKTSGKIKLGDIVQVPFTAFKFNDNSWVPDAYHKEHEFGIVRPYLKRVAGLSGDIIDIGAFDLLRVNGEIILNSVPMSHDKVDNVLQAFKLPVKLKSDEVWLMSDHPRGFDSRYLGPANINQCVKVTPVLIF